MCDLEVNMESNRDDMNLIKENSELGTCIPGLHNVSNRVSDWENRGIIINYERNNRPEYSETEVMDKISSLKGPLNLL